MNANLKGDLENRSTPDVVEGGLGQLGALLSLLKLLLSLPELGQVEGGDLLGLLNLLLVGLDLLLELVGQVRHALLVLLVFLLLELELLNPALGTLEGLVVLRGLGLDSSKLKFKLADSHLELGHGLLTTAHGVGFSVSQAVLKLTKLVLKSPLGPVLRARVVLLRAELISKPGSINHGALGLLLSILGLRHHLINLSLESVDLALNSPLLMHGTGVDGLHLVDSASGISKLLVDLALGAISRVKKGTGFLNFSAEGIGLPVRNANSFRDFLPGASLIFKGLDGFPELSLVPLDGLLSLGVSLVGMVEGNFKLVDVRLQLLLQSEGFRLGALLGFKRGGKRIHGTLVVLPVNIDAKYFENLKNNYT